MADVELVIKIDEQYIKQIDKIRFLIGGIEDRSLQINVINAIRNGTPLPKGHGRLIDADYMNERILELPIDELANENAWAMKVLCLAPTIIEADTNS